MPVISPELLIPFLIGGPGNVTQQSDVAEREIIFPGTYKLRHIAPKAASITEPGIVNPLGTGYAVLAKTLYAKPLPISHEPSSPDFHEGNYVLRLDDAGEWALSFPNRDASDGRPWRSRFNTNGHTEFIEISREGEVEHIGVIVKMPKDRQKIVISGYDGFWLLKKNYEKEYRGITAPRDLIERYTRVDVVPLVEEFAEAALPSSWGFLLLHGTSSYTMLGPTPPGPGVELYVNAGSGAGESSAGQIETTSTVAVTNFGAWHAQTRVEPRWNLGGSGAPGTHPVEVGIFVGEASFSQATLQLKGHGSEAGIWGGWDRAELKGSSSGLAEILIPTLGPSVSIDLECDGRWIAGYVNGVLVGYIPAFAATNLKVEISVNAGKSAAESPTAGAVIIGQTFLRIAKPFLLRGTNKGDYVLPGSASTYPYGGLHADYYSHGGSAADWQETVLAPDPRKPEPVVWQEPEINHTGTEWVPPVSGIPAEYFAVRWYGAVYLDLEDNATVNFALSNLDDGARLWVGKTFFGEQIIDEWKGGASRTLNGTVTAASLGAKKGWFPIILEHFNGEGARGIELKFELPTTGWTDPGGTFIASKTTTVIPSTSLSPLGCFNEPIQGQSHFDIIQNVAKQFGFQLALEPKQLETDEFPGQLIPVARVGKDFNEVVEADDIDRRSGINNYTYTLDATDSAASIRALGSGIADGKGSQVAFETLSPEAEEEALFDLQAFISEGNVAEPQLLAALAEAQLALRLGSWDNLSGEPIARDRLADTFPLTGKLSLLKWRAGDGVRVWLPDVGVEDTTPRAIMQVTRTFGPEGRIGTQIGFRSRPKDHLYALRQLLRSLAQPHRSSQGVYEDVPGTYAVVSLPEGVEVPTYSICPLMPQDRVISGKLRITKNETNKPLRVYINEVDQTGALGGPWSKAPVEIPVTSVITMSGPAAGRVFARLKNESGAEATDVNFQLTLTVLRA